MGALEQGFTSDVSTPALVAHTLFDAPNTLKDASTILFEVFDADGAVSVAKAAGDVVADRLALGTYAPTIALPSSIKVGKATVRWYFEQASDPGNELFYDHEFEVLPAGAVDDPLAPAYAFVHELRDEGISPKLIIDRVLYNKICIATDFVEMATGRHFVPIQKNVRLNGRRTSQMLLSDTIIGIGEVALDFGPLSTGEVSVEASDILVYNRHLTERLRQPDDRDHPRIELFHIPRSTSFERTHGDIVFPAGVQNVRILGIFGYTDPTPAALPVGSTPRLIRRATNLITIADIHKLGEEQKRFKSRNRWRIVEEEGEASKYKLDPPGNNPAAMGTITGNPEIDTLLARFMRPPRFGAA